MEEETGLVRPVIDLRDHQRAANGGAHLFLIRGDLRRLGHIQWVGMRVKSRIGVALDDVAAKAIDLRPPPSPGSGPEDHGALATPASESTPAAREAWSALRFPGAAKLLSALAPLSLLIARGGCAPDASRKQEGVGGAGAGVRRARVASRSIWGFSLGLSARGAALRESHTASAAGPGL